MAPAADTRRPQEPLVELRFATLPSVLGLVAVHYWFVSREAETGETHRWEVWQTRDAGGTSWGHLHRNLMPPERGVGGGPSSIAAEWRGEQARTLQAVLGEPLRYPFRDLYRYWPGPNSNTYVAWVLREAGVTHPLGWRGFGRGYPCP